MHDSSPPNERQEIRRPTPRDGDDSGVLPCRGPKGDPVRRVSLDADRLIEICDNIAMTGGSAARNFSAEIKDMIDEAGIVDDAFSVEVDPSLPDNVIVARDGRWPAGSHGYETVVSAGSGKTAALLRAAARDLVGRRGVVASAPPHRVVDMRTTETETSVPCSECGGLGAVASAYDNRSRTCDSCGGAGFRPKTGFVCFHQLRHQSHDDGDPIGTCRVCGAFAMGLDRPLVNVGDETGASWKPWSR